jgi:nitrous-oxide reductase
MAVAFQILLPGFDYDKAHCGKGPSKDWAFFTTYNTEQAHTLKEVNASQKDKDFIAAINWKKAETCVAAGKGREVDGLHYDNRLDEKTQTAYSEVRKKVRMITPAECPDMVYYLPTPKSPHGVDVDPSGEYIVGAGKLASLIPVHSFSKMMKAIENKAFEGDAYGIPVLKYDQVLAGEVDKPGLGPLHTEFDGKGNAYTSMFISSEIVKWKLDTREILDRIPCYYAIGHLMVPLGDTRKPYGKYVIALNKITKDRYLPTGPELTQSSQIIDISGEKMRLLAEFPTIGEPHYAQAAELLVMPGQTRTLKIVANRAGIIPFYCTDFCSALHQEMQGYIRVSPPGEKVDLTWSTGKQDEPAGT